VLNDKGLSKINNEIDTVLFEQVFRAESDYSDSTITQPKHLLEDSKQRIWIGQDQMVSLYDKNQLNNFLFANQYHTTSWTRGFSMVEDANKNIFAASQRGQLFRFDEAKRQFLALSAPKLCEVISHCLAHQDNKLLLATEKGVIAIELSKTGELLSWNLLIKLPNISFLAKDSQDRLLIGTWNTGLYTADLNKPNLNLTKITNLPFKVINDIFLDAYDNFWVSSDDGVAFLHKAFFVQAQLPAERNYLIAQQQGRDSSMYVTEGAIIAKVTTDGTFTSDLLIEGSKYRLKDILSVTQNQYGIWYGTSNAMVYRLKDNKIDSVLLNNSAAKVTYLLSDKNDHVWVCQHETKEVMRITPTMQVIHYGEQKGILSRVYAIKQAPDGNIYCGGNSKEFSLYQYDAQQDVFKNISSRMPVLSQLIDFRIDDIVIDHKKQIWLSGTHGLFHYQPDSTRHIAMHKQLEISALAAGNDGSLWLGSSEGLIKYHHKEFLIFDEMNGLPSKTISHRGISIDHQNHVWVATAAGLAYSQGLQSQVNRTPTPVFLSLKINGKKLRAETNKNIIVRNNSYLEAGFISLIFPSDKVLYQYRLVEKNNIGKWSAPNYRTEIILPQLHRGNYSLEIRALQQGAYLWSEPLRFKFNVETAWYLQWWAFVLYVVAVLAVIYLFFSLYTQHLTKEKEALENLVALRTQQIQEQKDNLDQQNKLLELQNINILASIHYAKRIQDAMLPTIKRMDELFAHYFVLFKPKDIVSGDFYWCNETKFALSRSLAKQIVAVVDCTGHGVPGAFMSLIANSLLDEICTIKGIEHTDLILKELNRSIQKSLKQGESENMDGLDIALCIIDKANQQIEFSGAKRPLFYLKDQQDTAIQAIKGHFHCIGGYHIPIETDYPRHIIPFEKEITLYLTSDGYQDQFGKSNKRLSSQTLRKVLYDFSTQAMSQQKLSLDQYFANWQADNYQNDDVLILGITILL
jgi:AraC family transcriptional regulator, chitin signaling transcriptional activator